MKRARLLMAAAALALAATAAAQQATDRVDADDMLFAELSAQHITQDYHQQLNIAADSLAATREHSLYRLRGGNFQVASLRSDVYLRKQKRGYEVVSDSRYPLETMNNLLLNHIAPNRHRLTLRHHQYGGVVKTVDMPMQQLFDLLAPNMKLYCTVTSVDKSETKAVLVFHNQRLNFIHLLQVSVPTRQLSQPESTLTADLFSNIPQSNVKSLFNDPK